MSQSGDLRPLSDALHEFAEERDWAQFHSPKNLAMALTVEAALLLQDCLETVKAALLSQDCLALTVEALLLQADLLAQSPLGS